MSPLEPQAFVKADKKGPGVAFRAPGRLTSMELAHRGLQESGESASARDGPGRLGVTRRVGEHLLDVDVYLAEERRRNRVAVALVGQERHPPLQAERLEDRLRDPERQAKASGEGADGSAV